MKRILLTCAVAAVVLAGCDNENTVNPIPQGEATIKVTVVADLDERETGTAPQPNEVVKNVPLYITDNASGAILAESVVTDSKGEATIVVNVGGPRNISIKVGDFKTDINVQVAADTYKSKSYIYNNGAKVVVNAVKGGSYIAVIDLGNRFNFDEIDFD